MIYWTTQSITSSCRLYYETLPLHSGAKPLTGSYVTVPTGVIWAKDIFMLPRKARNFLSVPPICLGIASKGNQRENHTHMYIYIYI